MARVLAVDDKEENLYFLRTLLEGNGYEVEVAGNGADALKCARQLRPDLVISDLLMPVMDGYALLREWKGDPELQDIPFMVYTATYTEPEDERLALRLGADAFIVKPAEPDSLLARIRGTQEKSRSEGSASPEEEGNGEGDLLRAYSQVLVRKLEKRTFQLEGANRALQEDIRERIRAREELERSSALVRMAGRAARIGGWVFRPEDGSFTWTDETCAIHDLPPGEDPSLTQALAFFAPRDRPGVEGLLERCSSQGDPFDEEFRIRTSSGRPIWVRFIGEPIRDGDAIVPGVQGAYQDISERKHLEEEFARAQRMESIATLTGGMAHDLNNLLTPVLLSVQLLKEDIRDEAALETLAIIESCAQRGSEMVSQVLSFARGVDGARVRVDVPRMVQDLERVVQKTFPPSLSLQTEVPDDLWPLTGDPNQIHQVLMNLLVNSRDAMPDGGRIILRAENVEVDGQYAGVDPKAGRGRHVRISVVDAGLGMPRETVERIFDPLFTTKLEGKGTGLGLATVDAILRAHDGFASVYSEPGVGTTLRVHLPVSEEGAPRLPDRGGTEGRRGGGECLLLVEDEAAIRSITQQTLETFGYRVVTATDGVHGLETYERRRGEIDLVLTDVLMPNMDGPALIRALKGMDPEVVIIATSGMGPDGGVTRARQAGAAHVLQKPYTADALLEMVHLALQNPVQGIGARPG